MWVFMLLLCCLLPQGAQEQMFPLQLEAPAAVLAAGSVLVNCSTECPSPSNLMLETSLLKQPNGSSPGWAAFWLSNLTEDTKIMCSVLCGDSQVIASSNITVYRFPEEVELGPLPSWQPVGENLTLRCLVVGGAPRNRLTAVLLRDQEELSRQPVTSNPEDPVLGMKLSLLAACLHLLFSPALPVTSPHLLAPRSLEVGTRRQVHCVLDGLFPASEAQVHLALGNQTLNPTVTRDGDTLNATATVRLDQEGTQKIVCNVTLAGVSRSAQKLTTVFSFPGPILRLSRTNVPKGSTVNVTCKAGPRAQVRLDGVLAPSPGEPAQLELIATDSDNGRYFICNATLEVAGELIYRSTAVQLRVLGRGHSVTIGLTVLTVLGVIITSGALLYVFGMQKRCGIYHVKQQSNSVPLTAIQQPEDTPGEEAS
ncbi:Intercellular adhesion molecule 3 [Fukomys damarensis]|uniref:Intercellular adhesion molecule 3 n=1 Tax=Fukomys damarensis TaxID=885580 RepID=A0A091E125_FUKDA|nr:Intercellular adhesion molecule 3 [Fukomys damarensis]